MPLRSIYLRLGRAERLAELGDRLLVELVPALQLRLELRRGLELPHRLRLGSQQGLDLRHGLGDLRRDRHVDRRRDLVELRAVEPADRRHLREVLALRRRSLGRAAGEGQHDSNGDRGGEGGAGRPERQIPASVRASHYGEFRRRTPFGLQKSDIRRTVA